MILNISDPSVGDLQVPQMGTKFLPIVKNSKQEFVVNYTKVQ